MSQAGNQVTSTVLSPTDELVDLCAIIVISILPAGSECVESQLVGRGWSHYASLRVSKQSGTFGARVMCAGDAVGAGPETERALREPSICTR